MSKIHSSHLRSLHTEVARRKKKAIKKKDSSCNVSAELFLDKTGKRYSYHIEYYGVLLWHAYHRVFVHG